jgi:NADPH:quinone reductase-like Zn-dependent oxidoreductase
MGTQAEFETVMGQVFTGHLRPVVDEVFPLAEYPAALARMLAGDAFGKILLKVV